MRAKLHTPDAALVSRSRLVRGVQWVRVGLMRVAAIAMSIGLFGLPRHDELVS
jgi:hypothetical protein